MSTALIADKFRASLLQAAIQGKLTKQLAEDGDARDLLTEIEAEKARLTEEKIIKSGRGGRSRDVIKDFIKESVIETSNLNHDFTFNNFVEGKSNQFALAACAQVKEIHHRQSQRMKSLKIGLGKNYQ